MGQKVNPNGLRLGINKYWLSRWFSSKEYAKFLNEDIKIWRSSLQMAGLPKSK
jgi:small subunit ribosomal protein S3